MFLADPCFQIPPSPDLLFLLGEGRPTPQRSICSFSNAPVSLLFFFLYPFVGEGGKARNLNPRFVFFIMFHKTISFLPYATHSKGTPVKPFITISILLKLLVSPVSWAKWSPLQGSGCPRVVFYCVAGFRGVFLQNRELASLCSGGSAAPAHSRALQ